MAKKFYITTPIYYVNDKPHIGHAYTTIAADVLARYYRQQEYDVFFLTGTDEHGAKVAQSAAQVKLTPKAFADQNSRLFKNTFEALSITNDYFVRTTDERHGIAVQKFMQQLYDNGDIYEGKYEGLYCVGCERFLTEKELEKGKCPDHKTVPEKVKEKNYFFKLKKYLPQVQKLIETDKIKIEPVGRKREVLGLFKQSLDDFSVSREKVSWGIPLPFDTAQHTYVWIEALQNYISAIGYGDNQAEFERWWPADVHLMARDILKFHAIYWPALLLAAGLSLPKELYLHGFFTINGEKMSKTQGNVIDPNVMIQEFGIDATRYLLLAQFPFGHDGDIKEELFVEKYNADLANNLGNLVSRTLNMIEKYADGRIPKELPSFISLSPIGKLITDLAFNHALKQIWKAIDEANLYIDQHQPWRLAKDNKKRGELREVLSQLAAFLLELAGVLEPFMPHTAATIIGSLNTAKITKGQSLFERK